jgi:hypothetical protein
LITLDNLVNTIKKLKKDIKDLRLEITLLKNPNITMRALAEDDEVESLKEFKQGPYYIEEIGGKRQDLYYGASDWVNSEVIPINLRCRDEIAIAAKKQGYTSIVYKKVIHEPIEVDIEELMKEPIEEAIKEITSYDL